MAFTKATFDYLDSGGLIKWITTPKTSAFTAVSGEGYLVDTTSAAITVTLPAAPSAGDEIIIVDYASNAGTNNITLGRNSLKIRGGTDDLVLSTNNQTARLLYSGATKGWLVTTEAGAGAGAVAAPALTVDYLVVAGGGGGGGFGGGGGAGGYRTSYGDASVSELSLAADTNYTVTVGLGGTSMGGSGVLYTDGGSGSDSVFSTITSSGGGGAGGYEGTDGNGISGGSGGGAGHHGSYTSTSRTGGAGNTPSTTPSQGNSGGDAGYSTSPSVYYGGGGGGGASASGGDSSYHDTSLPDGQGGNGGNGSANSITGLSLSYAGGGGGMSDTRSTATASSGGTGGGGGGGTYNGTQSSISAGNGTANTGGGGGGGYGFYGNLVGAGGSGVVILRYPDAYTISETTSPTVLTFTTATDGSDKVTTFTAGESGTIQFSS